MKKNIKINGKSYGVALTMGACREYRELTGKEIDKVSGFSDIADALFCCAKSTARCDGAEFDMSVESFADGLEIPEAITVFTELMSEFANANEANNGAGKKKKA